MRLFDRTGNAIPRDTETEAYITRKHLLEFRLYSTIGTHAMKKWLPNHEAYAELIVFKDSGDFHVVNGNRLNVTEPGEDYPTVLLNLYVQINNIDLKTAIASLCESFKISTNDDLARIGIESKWEQCNTICVRRKNDKYLLYRDEQNVGLMTHKNLIIQLPVSSIHLKSSNTPPRNLHLPFKVHGFYYNLKWAKLHPQAPIVLTDSIPLAEQNQHKFNLPPFNVQPVQWMSWFGGRESVDHLDFGSFSGRIVYCLVIQHSGLSLEETYKTALTVKERLEKSGVNQLRFIYYLDPEVSAFAKLEYSKDVPLILDAVAFEHYARRALSKEPLEPRESSAGTPSINPPTTMIEPVVANQSLSFIYGSGAISIVARSLAITAAQSSSSIFNAWHSDCSVDVIYLLGERVFRSVENGICPLHNCPSFRSIDLLNNQLDVMSLKGQDYIEECIYNSTTGRRQLIVLDGFLSLDEVVENKSSLEVFRNWVTRLIRKGVALWMIPPSGRISKNVRELLKPDTIIRVDAVNTGDPEILGMDINVEKSPFLYSIDAASLSVEIAPWSETPTWEVATSRDKYSKREQRLRQLVRLGRREKDIAMELDVSVAMVKKLKRKYGIRVNKRRHKQPKQKPNTSIQTK